MAAPDFELPSDFPDLTLPEKTEKTPEPIRPILQSPPSTAKWRVGDRVLAPWEPTFLYVGRIAQFDNQRALIEFEDGDAGWVELSRLQPLSVQRGQKVWSRRKMGAGFHAAEIVDLRGDQVVGFTDQADEIWTTVAALRIPSQATGPGAVPTKMASHLAFQENLQPGDRVWAPWNRAMLYAGTVDEIKTGEVHVHFDDSDRGWVLIEQVFSLEIPVGLFVLARRKMGNQYFPGQVTQVNGDRIQIQFDAGGKEWTKPAALAVPVQPFGVDARPTRNASGTRANLGWLIPVGIFVGLTLLRLGCR